MSKSETSRRTSDTKMSAGSERPQTSLVCLDFNSNVSRSAEGREYLESNLTL